VTVWARGKGEKGTSQNTEKRLNSAAGGGRKKEKKGDDLVVSKKRAVQANVEKEARKKLSCNKKAEKGKTPSFRRVSRKKRGEQFPQTLE